MAVNNFAVNKLEINLFIREFLKKSITIDGIPYKYFLVSDDCILSLGLLFSLQKELAVFTPVIYGYVDEETWETPKRCNLICSYNNASIWNHFNLLPSQ